ncbi:hypothetical protein DFH09DRAFT_1095914 [Mycena vulgaris]|nr:hypothetical protein DFH09DRAFT_1095914 [Mycena vulgaris]
MAQEDFNCSNHEESRGLSGVFSIINSALLHEARLLIIYRMKISRTSGFRVSAAFDVLHQGHMNVLPSSWKSLAQLWLAFDSRYLSIAYLPLPSTWSVTEYVTPAKPSKVAVTRRNTTWENRRGFLCPRHFRHGAVPRDININPLINPQATSPSSPSDGLSNLMLTSVMACRVYRHTRLGLTQASQIVPSSTHAPPPRRHGGGNDSLPLHFSCPLPDTTRKEDGGDFGGEGMEGRKGGVLGDSSRTSMAEECPLGKGAHDAV